MCSIGMKLLELEDAIKDEIRIYKGYKMSKIKIGCHQWYSWHSDECGAIAILTL